MGANSVKKKLSRAVFLDRDGVINRAEKRQGKPYPPSLIKDLKFFPKVKEAIQSLSRAGFKVIVVTNQPDVGKGVQTRQKVEAIHRKMLGLFAIDAIKVCYHVDADACSCRKPKPGMLLEAAKEWAIDLTRSILVGDRWRDIGAGKAAGCKTILVESGYDEKKAENPDAVVKSLFEASQLILSEALTSLSPSFVRRGK